MPYTSIAIAAQLLASDRVLAEQAIQPMEPGAVLVERTSADGAPSEVSVWMPIIADARTGSLNGPQLRRVAKETERIVATEEPTFVVDEYRAGVPRIGGHDGGVAGADDPGFDLTVSVFAASSIPPDLQDQLREAVAEVERYFERTLLNSVLGPGGVPQDVTLRLALRVTALASNVPGASQFRSVAVRMSELTQRLNEVRPSDPDDYQPGAPGYLDKDGLPVGASSLRVRYSSVSTAVSAENRVYLTRAQFKALGFEVPTSGPAPIQFDGTILMNSGFQWDYDPSDGVTLNQVTRFSFQDYFARELLIQLGWISGVEFLQRDMTMMDMFRFSSAAPASTVIQAGDSWIFNLPNVPPGPVAWINTEDGSARASNEALAAAYSSANQFVVPPLDYNPGLDLGLVAATTALNAKAAGDIGLGLDPDVLANLVSSDVVSPRLSPGSPDFVEAQKIVLRENLYGVSGLPVPMPNVSLVTVLNEVNRHDDAEWPALPVDFRTRYPDGAVPRVISWPDRPLVQWDFNGTAAVGPATNLAAPSTGTGTLRAVGAGVAATLLTDGPGKFDTASSSSDPSDGGKTMRFTGLAQGRSIEVRCSTATVTAPSVSFDIRLAPRASSTWRLSYSLNANAGTPTYATLGLENDGYIDLSGSYPQVSDLEDLGFVCRVRLDLPLGDFVPGANTGFRLSPVPPPGTTAMESVAQARGIAGLTFDASAPVEVDMVTVYPDAGAQILLDYNPSFRGHMPRLVARGARSHLNFGRRLLPPDPAPTPFFDDLFDNEIEVGTGNNFNNSRAAFLAQTSGAIPPWERFLMGQASTAGTTTIPRGISFWTRDPDAYQFGGPGTEAWRFRGELPDFLSYEEILILDHLGWDIVADVLDPTGSAGRNGAVDP